MLLDKYAAVWVSHSSISDFIRCPRAYYLNNVYKDPKTGHKISLVTPPLALGQAVHQVVESLSVLPVKDRFKISLIEKLNKSWRKISGRKGGFFDAETEKQYKDRGEQMLRRVMTHQGPLKKLAVKMGQDLPNFWLSEDEGIILCGKVDWLEYMAETDSVHIIDFKTSKKEESGKSLQLPIYHLLVHYCQERKVDRVSYWYLELSDSPVEQSLPDLVIAQDKVLAIARKIKLARKLERFVCPQGEKGCYACNPLEAVLSGEAELVGVSDFNQDVYVLKPDNNKISKSKIL